MMGFKKAARVKFTDRISEWINYTGAASMPFFSEIVPFVGYECMELSWVKIVKNLGVPMIKRISNQSSTLLTIPA